MSVLVLGLSHRSASLDVLERMAFSRDALPKALHQLHTSEHVSEGVILSTCNRVEAYAVVDGFHAGVAGLRRFLADARHVAPEEFSGAAYSLYAEDAVRHLFGVAGGIDSMVLGESQILAQVREAFRIATDEGTVGPVLSALFRQAIKTGRRARAETRIGRSGASFATAGAALARRELGELGGSTALVIGAGTIGDHAAAALASQGARILVANRTDANAVRLAARLGGAVVRMGEVDGALAEADLVLCTTGAADPIITVEMVASAMRRRPGRRLVLLDMAVPRDVEPAVAWVDGVTLRDLDDLGETLQPSAEQVAEVERVRAIVQQETPTFVAWQRAYRLAPLMEALHVQAEGVRSRELRRAAPKLAALETHEREAVEALSKAIVAKMLHRPVAVVKDAAGSQGGEDLARALSELFGLES